MEFACGFHIRIKTVIPKDSVAASTIAFYSKYLVSFSDWIDRAKWYYSCYNWEHEQFSS